MLLGLSCLKASASSSAEDGFFFSQFRKNGTVGSRSYSISLAGETIYNNIAIADTPGNADVFSFAEFSRPLVPGVKYPLTINLDDRLEVAVTLSLPEGLTAEIDGVLGNSFIVDGGTSGITTVKELIVRDKAILEAQIPTPVGMASEIQIDDLSMRIGLGKLASGHPAGFVQYVSSDLENDAFSRKSLSLLLGYGSDEVKVGYEDLNSDGIYETPRYIKTPSIFVDFVDAVGAQDGFDIVFYSDGVANGLGGYIPALGAEILVKYTFRRTAPKALTIVQFEGLSGTLVARRSSVITTTTDGSGNIDWSLVASGGGLSITTTADTEMVSGKRIVTRSTSYGNAPTGLPVAANQIFKVQEEFSTLSGAGEIESIEKLTRRTFNPGGGTNERSEYFRYWENPSDTAQFGLLRAKKNDFGEWSYFEYEDLFFNRFGSPLENLAEWSIQNEGLHLAYALMPFHRRIAFSYAPFGDGFNFDIGTIYDWDYEGKEQALFHEYYPGLSWNEAEPRDSRRVTLFPRQNGSWFYIGLQDLKPIAIPTAFTLGQEDHYRDFVNVSRKFLFSDEPDLTDGADSESYSFEATYVPHALDAQFDERKAFKPAYHHTPDGRKTVFGYSEINGYGGVSDASWAEIEVSGTGATRKAYAYTMDLVVRLSSGSTVTYANVPLELALRFTDFMDDPKQRRRNSYLGSDGQVTGGGGSSANYGPYEHLWQTSSLNHNGMVFSNIDSINLVNGKSSKNLKIFNDKGDMVLREGYVLDHGDSWRMIERERFVYDGFGRLRQVYLSRDGGSTERLTYECVYDGLRKDHEMTSEGQLVDYSYDGLGRINGRTISSTHGLPGLPNQLQTSVVYDALGRVAKEVDHGNGSDTLVEITIYDAQGLVLSKIDQNELTVTFSHSKASDAGRKITTLYPDNSTYEQVYSKDGKIKRETGTAVTDKFYSYKYEFNDGSGHLTARMDEGINDPGTPHPYLEETKDFSDRVVRQVTSNANGTKFIKNQFYDPKANRLTSIKETTVSQDGSVVSESLHTMFEYNEFGDLVRVGTDIDGTAGVLNANSSDRMSQIATRFITVGSSSGGVTSHLSAGTYYEESVSVFPKNGSSVAFTSYTHSKLNSMTANQLEVQYTRDAKGNTSSTTDTINTTAGVRTSTSLWYGDGTSASVVSALGLVASETSRQGHTASYRYDGFGRPTLVRDPRGHSTRVGYHQGTNRIATTESGLTADGLGSGQLAQYFYNGKGQMNRMTNEEGHDIFYEYDDRGQILRQWGEATHPVEYFYDPIYGRLDRIETHPAEGQAVTKFEYHQHSGDLSARIDDHGGKNRRTEFEYDARGRLRTVTLPSSTGAEANTITTPEYQIVLEYDPFTDELLEEKYIRSGTSTPEIHYSYVYQRTGDLAQVTERVDEDLTNPGYETSGVRAFNYDFEAGPAAESDMELISEDLPSYYTSFSNSAAGSDTSHRVNRVAYGYASPGIVGRLSSVGLGVATGSGGLSSSIHNTSYGYEYGRISWVDAEQHRIDYTYVPNSNLLHERISTVNLVETRSYEPLRDLLTGIGTTHAGANRVHHAYQYDSMGRRKSVTQSGSHFKPYGGLVFTKFGYNARSEIENIDVFQGGDDSGLQIVGRSRGFTYDDMGNRKTETHKDAPSSSRTFDYGANNLNQYTTRENPSSWGFVSGMAPRTVRMSGALVSNPGPSGITRFDRRGDYFAGYLLSGQGPPGGMRSEDAVIYGARLAAGDVNPVTGIPDDILSEETIELAFRQANEVYKYDARGNLTQDAFYIYEWDARDRLKRVTPTQAALTAGVRNERIEFRYDYLNRRYYKRVTAWTGLSFDPATAKTSLFYWQAWNLMYEAIYSGANNLFSKERKYYWGLDWSGTPDGAGGVGGMVAMTIRNASGAPGGLLFPAYDGNGNLMAAYDSSGQPMAEFEYSAYGELLRKTGSVADDIPFRFATKYYDAETKLVYYNYRYYSPDLGRFLSSDPIGESGGLNLYAFVNNNPVSSFDFLGLERVDATFYSQFYVFGSASGTRDFSGGGVGSSLSGMSAGLIGVGDALLDYQRRKRAYDDALKRYEAEMEEFRIAQANLEVRKAESNNLVSKQAKQSIGQPGFWEGAIPIWGSGRAAIDDFQNGKWGWGLVNTFFAVTDVFLVKSLVVAIGKVSFKALTSEVVRRWSARIGTTLVEAGRNSLNWLKAGTATVVAAGKSAWNKMASWFRSPKAKPSTAAKTTDFMAGRLGGELYDARKLQQLGGYLEKRGFKLRMDGDDIFPSHIAGGFDGPAREIILRTNPTQMEVWHELSHFRQFQKLGPEAYIKQTTVTKEQFVFDLLENSPRRWSSFTPEQRSSAVEYIYRIGGIR